VSGYIVGARQQASTGPSAFDRILILPTSTASPTARIAAAPPPTPAPAPVFVPSEPDDAQDAAETAAEAAAAGRPLTAAQMQNQIREANARAAAARLAAEQDVVEPPDAAARPATPAATPAPTNPFFSGTGSGRPGEITPVPQQPRNPLRPNGDPEP
jgi:hypothetical protein